MGAHFHLVRLLDILYERRREGLTALDLLPSFPGMSRRNLRRVLTRLRSYGILRLEKRQKVVTGRPPLRWRLNERGLAVLDLLGPRSERLTATWPDIQQLSATVKILARLGSLSPKTRKYPPIPYY